MIKRLLENAFLNYTERKEWPRFLGYLRRGLLLCDAFLISFSWFFACYWVLGSEQFWLYLKPSLLIVPVLVAFKVFFFHKYGLYRAILRYASFYFAQTIVKATTIGSFPAYVLVILLARYLPFGVFAMDWLLTLLSVMTLRFLPRYLLERVNRSDDSNKKRVLLYGAGDIGCALARSLLELRSAYLPVGYIDDDVKKRDKRLHNLSILGTGEKLRPIIQEFSIDEVFLCTTPPSPEWLRWLIKECRTQKVFCRMAPKLSDIQKDDVHMQNIDIADLLKRDPKSLDLNQIRKFLKGRKILITGAAGSIGSELARQVLRFSPKEVFLLDNSEFGLYQLEEELRGQKQACLLKFILEDLCHQDRIDKVFVQNKPEIVFHAAAYKHVPILEANPCSGVINNIQGTINLALAADKYSLEKFVMISTDKAVHPTSLMGATKRVCELYVQNLNSRSVCEFLAVRFGNVLGSSGSVIPKFLEQIRTGGPVTVTHPDMTRFFMLTSEAVQLVMQAASIGQGGEIFILDMGQPVRIVEMAEDLIFLSGKTPHEDVAIEFIGLRKGEKLFEELFLSEVEKKTQYDNILIGKTTYLNWDRLTQTIERLFTSARDGNRENLLLNLKELVPEFQSSEIPPVAIVEKKLVAFEKKLVKQRA